jgi:1,3-beta-glucan synthase
MYREYLLFIITCRGYFYHQADTPDVAVCVPPFFVAQTDKGFKGCFLPPGSKVELRILSMRKNVISDVSRPFSSEERQMRM